MEGSHMKTNAALKAAPDGERTKPPARSPERTALADAISRRAACEQAREAGQRALARATEALAAVEAKIQDLTGATARASEQDACETAEAYASGKAPPPSSTTKKARAALADAQDEAEAARGAVTKLRSNLGDLEDAVLHSRNLVVAHADNVLRAAAGQALAEAETLALRLRELRPLLWYFLDPSVTPDTALSTPRRGVFSLDWAHEAHQLGKDRARERSFAASDAARVRDRAFNEELGPAIKRFVEAPPDLVEWNWPRLPSLAPWHKCREALIAGDPDAPLPR
jgi:hypothetical protein